MNRKTKVLFSLLILIIIAMNLFSTAATSPALSVQMYNGNTAAQINTIFPWFKITNTGSEPVALATVKIRYFYTIDGEKDQNYWCDWSNIGAQNVTGTFAKLAAPFSGADYYFELGFKPQAGNIQPGQSVEAHLRFAKTDWSNYNQTNDYSFNPTAKTYMDWNKIEVLITGQKPVTVHDYPNDGQWVKEPVTIGLTVSQGSGNITTYYRINNGAPVSGKLIQINNDGIYDISFWSEDAYGNSETPQTIQVKLDQTAPVIQAKSTPAANSFGWHNQDVAVSFTATDNLSGIETVTPAITANVEGAEQVFNGTATDNAGNSAAASLTVNIDKTTPVIRNIQPANGAFVNLKRPTISAELIDNLSGIDPVSIRLTLDGQTVNGAYDNNTHILTYTPAADLSAGVHTVVVNVSDKAGNPTVSPASSFTTVISDPDLPPDPAVVAPKLDPTIVTDMKTATSFLYTGENPIQTGMDPETIEPRRAAVIRGKVLDKDGKPLPRVKVSVLNHGEYGQTISRADGMFDLAVNGGGMLTVKYEREGYLSAQRQVNVPWQDYVWAPDVYLIQPDSKSTTITLSEFSKGQLAQGSTVTDSDGARQAAVFFPAGTTINGYSGDSVTFRATEFTVGENGPKMMPAALPAASAYTYCVDLSFDEVESVTFNQTIYIYTDNFLNFSVGGNVPAGYYDTVRAAWIPSDNGVIIRILGVTDDLAEIDVDGSGTVANAATLTGLGFTDAERQKLAEAYTVGKTLWRVPIKHFTYIDLNWGWWGPPSGATKPNGGAPTGEKDIPDPHSCYVERETQTTRESVDIPGTSFSLNYTSDRAPTRVANYSLNIPLSGDTVPASLKRIDLEIEVAGQIYQKSFSRTTNQSTEFTWDGNDGYGRPVTGIQVATVKVKYVYPLIYQTVSRFGEAGSGTTVLARSESETTLSNSYSINLGTAPNGAKEVYGWSFNVHHAYDTNGKVLYLGDGSKRSADNISAAVTAIAGTGEQAYSGDGGLATKAKMRWPYGLAVDVEGNVYIGDVGSGVLRRVDATDGTISTVAGSESNWPFGVATDKEGNIYIADTGNNRIRRIDLDGTVTTVAGTGEEGYSGDGGLATQAKLYRPSGIAIGADGSIYIVDTSNQRIRRVAPDGIITTIVGTGVAGYSGDESLAIQAKLYEPWGIAIAADGSIYIADRYNHRIRRVDPNGIITTVAGNGKNGYTGDNGPATDARLELPTQIAFDKDDNMYIADQSNNCIRRVGIDGIIITFAGTGIQGYSGDGGSAVKANFCAPWGMAVGPDGNLYISDPFNYRIRKVSSCLPGFTSDQIAIASEDGGELYQFDANGRHLKTLDAVTGIALYTFGYDSYGQLISITDQDGNVTTITRSEGQAVITGPFSQQTVLTINSDGYLETLTNAAGEIRCYAYADGGLLTTITDPKGQSYKFTYDEMGRAIKQQDPDSSSIQLERSDIELGYQVQVTEKKDNTNSYFKTFSVETLSTGETRRLTVENGVITEKRIFNTDAGTETNTLQDGTIISTTKGPDPRFGMQAPIISSMTITTPGGKVYTMTGSRTVTLSDSTNLLSLLTQTDTVTINGKTSTSVYDATSKVVTTTSPEGRQSVSTLDAKGRVIKTEVPGLAPVFFEYDSYGRLHKITSGIGSEARISTISYNSQGYVESTEDPLGRITRFYYDAVGRVTKQVLSDNKEISFTYDANGNVTTLTPPGKSSHGFDYTAVDLEDKYTPPEVGAGNNVTQYGYNLAKQPTLITRPDGQTIGFEYDTNGRLLEIILPNNERLTYGYDAIKGVLNNIIAPNGSSLAYEYDGSLLKKVVQSGLIQGSVEFGYNNDFAVTSVSVNESNPVSYAYDNDGLLTSAGNLAIRRDAGNGMLTGTTLRNVTDSITYNGFGETDTYRAVVNGSSIFEVKYQTDKLGRIETKTETVDGVTHIYRYIYDLIGQLTDVYRNGSLVSHYDYDSNGNRIGGTYDDQDRMLQYGGNSYQYTANGELKSKTNSEGTTQFDYDVLGNLRAVDLVNGTKIQYIIDGQNRRIGKKVNGTLVQGFLYQDGLNPVAELDASGNVVARFVYGTRANVPDYMVKGGVTYRIVSDHLGSVRFVVNAATGDIVQKMEYDEFGKVLSDTAPGMQPFGFAGGLYDKDTGLVRFGARDYDAETGRWTCKDPIGFSGGDMQLYGYAGDDPVNRTDVLGLKTYGLGWSGSLAFIARGELTIMVVTDDNKNWGLYVSTSAGGGFPTASSGVNFQYSTADEIYNLRGGFGSEIQIGGSAPIVGGEGFAAGDLSYTGVNVTVGAVPPEFHATVTARTDVWSLKDLWNQGKKKAKELWEKMFGKKDC